MAEYWQALISQHSLGEDTYRYKSIAKWKLWGPLDTSASEQQWQRYYECRAADEVQVLKTDVDSLDMEDYMEDWEPDYSQHFLDRLRKRLARALMSSGKYTAEQGASAAAGLMLKDFFVNAEDFGSLRTVRTVVRVYSSVASPTAADMVFHNHLRARMFMDGELFTYLWAALYSPSHTALATKSHVIPPYERKTCHIEDMKKSQKVKIIDAEGEKQGLGQASNPVNLCLALFGQTLSTRKSFSTLFAAIGVGMRPNSDMKVWKWPIEKAAKKLTKTETETDNEANAAAEEAVEKLLPKRRSAKRKPDENTDGNQPQPSEGEEGAASSSQEAVHPPEENAHTVGEGAAEPTAVLEGGTTGEDNAGEAAAVST
eukprot:GHVU01028809.1.p1 GENE.GHVU01028809.1~~GHVU01028809.1.p1  ORF type:complete len:371 (-),score=68.77 GHVU01028809.1:119-1231(-)